MRSLVAPLAVLALLAALPASAAAGPDAQPNLAVLEYWLTPEEPVPGDEVTFHVRIANQGDAAAPATTTQFCIVGMGWIVFSPTQALGPGEEVVVASEAWTATGVEAEMNVFADIDDDVAESDETDNDGILLFQLGPGPDLVVEDLATDPEAPVQGAAVRLLATVLNQGRAMAGAFEVRLGIGGDELGVHTVPALASGERVTLAGELWAGAAGTHTAWARSDAADALAEENEANNDRSESLRVAATPPLALSPDGRAQGALAISGTGDATGLVALSGTGRSEALHLAVSAGGDAVAPEGTAVSGTGDAEGGAAVSLTGDARGKRASVSGCAMVAALCGPG